MNLTRILEGLREELIRVRVAIAALEQLGSGLPRRGRPPGSKSSKDSSFDKPARAPKSSE